MAEVRRCRRCKRKRMDDEPPEVKQYKTCAKCRIIERQKKKSRKPLAEETMIYGMKQFQQQSTNSNFSHDDIFMDDELFTKKKADNPNLNLNTNQYNQYQYAGNNQKTNMSNIGINGVAGSDLNSFDPTKLTSTSITTNNYNLQNLNYQQIAQKALPIQSTNLPDDGAKNPLFCDICNNKLDLNDEISTNYKLCLNCYSNPFKLYNTFDDYNEFLKSISGNTSKNINNNIFLKEIDKNFIDNLNNINKSINNESQFREFILENLKKIYIEPIIASIGYEFTLVSSNVSELSFQPPTSNTVNQYQYKNTKPLKAYYKCLNEVNDTIPCESNLFLDYNLFYNFLKIKFNHKVHNHFLKYPTKFIDHLHSIYGGLEMENKGFDPTTAGAVYEELVKDSKDFEDVVDQIDKEEFIKEFPHLESIFDSKKGNENGDNSENGDKSMNEFVHINDSVDTGSMDKILDPTFDA